MCVYSIRVSIVYGKGVAHDYASFQCINRYLEDIRIKRITIDNYCQWRAMWIDAKI